MSKIDASHLIHNPYRKYIEKFHKYTTNQTALAHRLLF
jgi:hypothetical protein